ncbi:FapA family protein [Robertmurraya massiliosenegalensis]|uniref:flagellar assembly protein A n=1 Tax=Robertmurraya TaxID=2837507 RepID=UPI0039A4FFD0
MSQSVLSKGKNVMEAIELGLQLLATKKEEVSIEVIQQETKGFLRLGSRQAVVKLTKIKSPSSHSELVEIISPDNIEDMIENIESPTSEPAQTQIEHTIEPIFKDIPDEELEGKVWVKDGQIFCKASELHYPTITVGKGVKLLKNNELVHGTTIATEEDHFELQTTEEVKETKWNITMDSDRLHVVLLIEPGMRKICKVKDTAPDFHIVLEAEETVEMINDLKYKEVLSSLEELKVIHGFNHSEIMRAVNTDTKGQFTIASGIPPKDGENGRIQLMVDTDTKRGLKERTNGTVDFREIQVIPTVQKGQVVAIVHPPIPGTPGYTVTNEPLPPKPTYPLIIQYGKGTTFIENQNKIVATETGRPMVEQKGLLAKVSIIPKLVHEGDVNISSGNIRFKGDVDILGHVEDGMVVEGEGNVGIFKNVYSASVSSTSTLTIHGNVIGSTISAGKQNIFTSEMVYMLANIHEQMQKLLSTIHQLMNLPAFKTSDYSKKGLLPLIKILLEKKFQLLNTHVQQFIGVSKKGSHLLDLEWLTLAEQLRLCFQTSVSNEYHSPERLTALLKKIEEMIEKNNNDKDKECIVKLKYALNSKIHSGGNVFITGQGCYNSKVHSGGNIMINGVLRGGEIYARLEANIKEVGSEGGVISKVIVSNKGIIKIGLAKESTVIQIGKVKHTFQKEQRNVVARLDENERLVL